MSKHGGVDLINSTLHIVITVLFIIIVASLAGVDGCTCGYGPTVRKNVKQLIHTGCKPCSSNKVTYSSHPKK